MGTDPITLPDDLVGMVKRWTSNGTMRFRWPTDDETGFTTAGKKWASDGEVEAELERLNPQEDVKAVLQNNEGPAIEAFGDYWHDVPARNIEDLIRSFKVVSAALSAVAAAVIAYKNASIDALSELKKELDDNEKWAWLPWSDDDAIHKRAVGLIGLFDEFDQSRLSEFRGSVANSSSVIKQESKLYDDIAKRHTPETGELGKKLLTS
jgi:hypothetical protein